MRNKTVILTTQAAIIAALYVVITYMGAAFGFGEVQVRISEMLTVLPIFTPAAIPGLFVGCLIGNTLAGAVIPDIIGGSIATLIGAVGTYLLRKHRSAVAVIPPIAANVCIVPFILKYAYAAPFSIPFMMLTVGIGEVISCGILGCILIRVLKKYRNVIFKNA